MPKRAQSGRQDLADLANPPLIRNSSAWAAGLFSLSNSQQINLIWLLILLACLVILVYLQRRKSLLKRQDPDLLGDPSVLEHAMWLAVDQNAALLVRQNKPGEDELDAPRPLNCLFLNWENNQLIAQLGQDQTINHSLWTGSAVLCSFFVELGGDKFFLECDSKIRRISQDQDLCLLALALPTGLRISNRRGNARFSPDPEAVLALGVWPLWPADALAAPIPDSGWEAVNHQQDLAPTPPQTPLPGQDAEALPSLAQGLPRPYLAYFPGLRHEAHLADLSASGLGLRVERGQACLLPEHCLVLLCLHSRGRRLCLWLACRRRHISARRGRSSCVAGLDIRRWALYSGIERPIDWKRPDNNGAAAPLRNWLVRHQATERKKMSKFVNL